MADFTHRIATLEDLDALREVMRRSIATLQTGFLTPEQVRVSHTVMGLDTQLIRDGTYFIVERDGRIAGCGGWSWRSTLYGGDDSMVSREPEALDPATDAARIRAIVDVCTRLATGELVVAPECERAQLRADLLAIPGIGPWTAGYLAMRVTREPDELLVSDLALRNGAVRLGLPGDAKALAARGERWAPWRSYASMHLWRAAASA